MGSGHWGMAGGEMVKGWSLGGLEGWEGIINLECHIQLVFPTSIRNVTFIILNELVFLEKIFSIHFDEPNIGKFPPYQTQLNAD